MKCQECEPLLEEYLDGELDAGAASAVAAHVRGCAACAEVHNGLAAEQSLYAAYERDVEVAPELWGGIEARLQQRAERPEVRGEVGFLRRLSLRLAPFLVAPRFSPALTAALLVVAVVMTVAVMRSLDPRGNSGGGADELASADKNAGTVTATVPTSAPNDNAPPAAMPTETRETAPDPQVITPRPDAREPQLAAGGGSSKKGIRIERAAAPAGASNAAPRVQQSALKTAQQGREQTPDRLVREAEQRYVAAIRILERDVRTRRSRLDGQTLARFDESLASIDRTIAETRKSVRRHGNDPVAVQYMLSAYAKKVEVMREIAHLGGGN